MGVNTFSPNSSQGFVMTHSQLLGTFETFFYFNKYHLQALLKNVVFRICQFEKPSLLTFLALVPSNFKQYRGAAHRWKAEYQGIQNL